MKGVRSLGYKIHLLLKENNAPHSDFCNYMNWSDVDLNRVIHGRLCLSPRDLQKIALYFNVTIKSLLSYKNNDCYKDFRKCDKIMKQENFEEILDIMDSYIDIKDTVEQY